MWSRHSCQSHDLLASKLNAYGLETSAVDLIFDYLTNRKQQIKIDCHYSSRRCSPGCCKCLRWLTIVATLSILDIYGEGWGGVLTTPLTHGQNSFSEFRKNQWHLLLSIYLGDLFLLTRNMQMIIGPWKLINLGQWSELNLTIEPKGKSV